MLIVIPVGPSDAPNLRLLTQAITRLGVVENPVLIVSVPSLQAEAEEAATTLGATVAITSDEFANGWPVGPDRMFIWTIRHLAEIENEQPWLWLEPDAPPVKARWDVLLADDYRAAGKPYYGFVRPTAWRDAEGNLTPQEGDNMLLGVAIYPPDMHKDKELLPLLNDLSLPRPSHPPVPWDIYLRWHQFRRGVHSTTLIYDRWRTCNYTRGEFDEILCEPVAGERGAVGGAIPDEAVLVHGCKDGSLHRLVIGEEAPKVRFVLDEVPFVQPPLDIKAVGFATALIKTDKFRVLRGAPKGVSEDVVRRVLEALNKLDQPRLGAVADLSKVDKDTVKKLLPTLGYEILNAGWIRKLPTK
jgi:hypothetical protein